MPKIVVEQPTVVNTKLAYTLLEAAEATGYSRRVIEYAIRDNHLVASYANSKPVIRTVELLRWLDSLPTER